MSTSTTEGKPESRSRRLRRRLLRWAFLALITYLGLIVVFWFLERQFVFRPSSAEEAWLKPEDARTQDVWFYSGDGNKISGRWIPPETPQHGAVLVTNGNGGNLTHRGRLAADLRKSLGAGVLLFDYPGYGKSSGKPTEEGCYAAGEAAYKWLTEEQKIPPSRIILCGESLGGGTAVELATRHDHRALVLIYTFTSLPDRGKVALPVFADAFAYANAVRQSLEDRSVPAPSVLRSTAPWIAWCRFRTPNSSTPPQTNRNTSSAWTASATAC